MNSHGVRKTLCSSDREDAVEGRTSVITGSVSGPPRGNGGGSNKGLVGNTLFVSESEVSVTLVSAGGALLSVAS